MPRVTEAKASSTTAQSPRPRIAWVDVAKSLAILLVVVYHVSGWFFTLAFGGSGHPLGQAWRELSVLLIPIRIPLFFLVSGVLAHAAVRRSWGDLARTRLSSLLWPFAVWTLMIAPLWFLRLDLRGSDGWEPVLGSILHGGTHLWFLTALAVFLVIGKLVSRAHWAVLLPAAAALAFIVRPYTLGVIREALPVALAENIGRWMAFLFWFLLGCFARRVVAWIADHMWIFVIMGTAFTVMMWVTNVPTTPLYRTPLLGLTGLTGLVALSALLARSDRIHRLSQYLAARTLAIYVGHALLLEVLAIALLLAQPGLARLPKAWLITSVVFVPAMTALLAWATTRMYDRARGSRFGWLYEPPARFTQRSPAPSC